MEPIFKKVVDEDGNETYVEIKPTDIELPDEHPLNAKLKQVTEESIARRKRIKELREQLEHEAEETPPTPETPKAETPKAETPAIDPKEIARLALAEFKAEQEAAQKAKSERDTAIDSIMKETGLRAALRPVIARIPNLEDAKAAAQDLAKASTTFGQPPSAGNGDFNMNAMLDKVNERLKLGD